MRQRTAFLEKALHAMPECAQMLVGDDGHDLAVVAQRQRVGQVFLDCHRRAILVVGQIDDGEASQRQLPLDAVEVQLETGGKGLVGLRRRHDCYTAPDCSSGVTRFAH